jgi:hypothetical protein
MSQLVALRFLPATFSLLLEHAPAAFYFCFPNWVLEQCPLPSTHLKVGHLSLSLCLARPQKNRTVLERNVSSVTFLIPVIICDYSEWDLSTELHI